MNMLRRAPRRFHPGREAAVSALRRAEVVASDETGVRNEGLNAFHGVFHSAEAGVHQASPTRGAAVVREMRDGHRPAVGTVRIFVYGRAVEHPQAMARV